MPCHLISLLCVFFWTGDIAKLILVKLNFLAFVLCFYFQKKTKTKHGSRLSVRPSSVRWPWNGPAKRWDGVIAVWMLAGVAFLPMCVYDNGTNAAIRQRCIYCLFRTTRNIFIESDSKLSSNNSTKYERHLTLSCDIFKFRFPSPLSPPFFFLIGLLSFYRSTELVGNTRNRKAEPNDCQFLIAFHFERCSIRPKPARWWPKDLPQDCRLIFRRWIKMISSILQLQSMGKKYGHDIVELWHQQV